jgi:ABC-2 type transport system permease protein
LTPPTTPSAAVPLTHSDAHVADDTATVGLWLPALTLWKREMVRFLRQRNRVVSSLLTPAIFWLFLGTGLDHMVVSSNGHGQQSAGATQIEGAVQSVPAAQTIGYRAYFFPGTITMILLFTAIFSTISVIEDRREGFMQGVLVAPAPRLAIVLGKVLGGTTLALGQALLFTLIWPLVGDIPSVGWCFVAVGVMALMAVGLCALGLCIAWPMDSTAGFHAIMMVLLMPMWFLCGSVFPVAGAPTWLKVIMLANPLTYGQAALSSSFHGGRAGASMWPVWVNVAIFAAAAAIALAAATAMVSRPRKDGT